MEVSELRKRTKEIENRLGRRSAPAGSSDGKTVEIDIDILLFDNCVLDLAADGNMKPLHLPHADILKYAHAVVPLAELAPDLLHPETGQRLGEIASKFLATAEPPLIRKVIPEVTADSGSGDKL